jgi:hypothetical protein
MTEQKKCKWCLFIHHMSGVYMSACSDKYAELKANYKYLQERYGLKDRGQIVRRGTAEFQKLENKNAKTTEKEIAQMNPQEL